jgi:hypothetical protein
MMAAVGTRGTQWNAIHNIARVTGGKDSVRFHLVQIAMGVNAFHRVPERGPDGKDAPPADSDRPRSVSALGPL